jgi:hypothetical protein
VTYRFILDVTQVYFRRDIQIYFRRDIQVCFGRDIQVYFRRDIQVYVRRDIQVYFETCIRNIWRQQRGKSEAVIRRTDKYTGQKKRDNKGEIWSRNSKDRQVYWPKEKRQQRRTMIDNILHKKLKIGNTNIAKKL